MPRLDGFDGAHYQTDHGKPNLVATLLAGLWWIAWKVSQSDQYLDPTFAGIRSSWGGFRMRGMYHWLSSTKDVHAQVANYMRGIGIIQHGEFCMLDAEEKGITVAMCLLWCELVEAITHRPCVIYTGLYVAGGTIWNSPELRMSKYGPRPFIVAAYVSEANLLARMAALHALQRDAWQYSSDGPVPGIVGRCDMDQIDNVTAFELVCEISQIVPQPSTEEIVNYYVVTGASAGFIGTPAAVQWTGPGDAKVQAAIDTQLAAGNLTLVNLTGGPMAFGATFLTGPLPTGDSYQWTGDEFANAAAIKSGHGADPAMAAVAALQSTVQSLDTEVGRIRDWAHSGTNT